MVIAFAKYTASAAFLLVASCAFARPNAEVEALQMPTWIVRDGIRTAMSVGMQLKDHDEIQTGAGSRVLLRMGDGSTVKLGENARFRLDGMRQQAGRSNLFKASLRVIEGAFRFTTQALYKFRGKREVDVHFVTATAGIRGTDLWGKSVSDQEIVCLIEGKISVTRAGEAPVAMQDANTVYRARRDAPSGPIAPVDPAELARWAAETEIEAGAAAVRKGGPWKVYVHETTSRISARAQADRLREGGYPAQLLTVSTGDEVLYRIYLGGFRDRAQAQALASRLHDTIDMTETSVSSE